MKIRRRILRGVAKTRKTLKKTPVASYSPLYGERTLAGYQLTEKQKRIQTKARKTSTRKTKRQGRRILKKLIFL